MPKGEKVEEPKNENGWRVRMAERYARQMRQREKDNDINGKLNIQHGGRMKRGELSLGLGHSRL